MIKTNDMMTFVALFPLANQSGPLLKQGREHFTCAINAMPVQHNASP